MATSTQHHPTQPMTTPQGDQVDIDVEMVELITELWRLGYTTFMSCQNGGESVSESPAPRVQHSRLEAFNMGRAWVAVAAEEAPKLLAAITTLPGSDDWSAGIRVTAEGPKPYAHVSFPREQIRDAVELAALILIFLVYVALHT